ncbi:MAG: adenosylcobinamide-phosphate synthase CbiB [Candidatus Omnitrophica bacterium]|nr:adenosylcobinamide-phosphate synthase CbiB [Candidatus Omnitrophota bacterium]
MEILISVFLIDLIIGDPESFKFHPIRLIGRLIKFFENILRKGKNGLKMKLKGIIFSFLIIFIVVGITSILYFLSRTDYRSFLIFSIFCGWVSISIKDLQDKAKDIKIKLKKKDLEDARKSLSKIVGRDTRYLSEKEIIKATIESISENTNDGIISPFFYFVIGGPILSILYKTVNTLDSMVGYKNEKYIDFGWFSAKFDDILNFIPARITGVLISISGFFLGYSFLDSIKTIKRYGRKHPSPNSGIPESAIAGTLGIKLGGPIYYNGKKFEKPYLGEKDRDVKIQDIDVSLKISFLSSFLFLILGVILKYGNFRICPWW